MWERGVPNNFPILKGILLCNIYDKFYAIIMIEQDLGAIP